MSSKSRKSTLPLCLIGATTTGTLKVIPRGVTRAIDGDPNVISWLTSDPAFEEAVLVWFEDELSRGLEELSWPPPDELSDFDGFFFSVDFSSTAARSTL